MPIVDIRRFQGRAIRDLVVFVALALMFASIPGARVSAAEAFKAIAAPLEDSPPGRGNTSETALLAGGCFWGVQGVFQHVDGVTSAVSGYAGGQENTARYPLVSRGDTGHAETVKIEFDPTRVSFGQILQIYFSVAHDPTQLNRQGPDTGTQYRSAIFPTSSTQTRIAEAYISQLDKSRVFDKPIVTKIEPDMKFYPAEEYHQDFLVRNPTYPYIVFNDLPKVENLRVAFPDRYRPVPKLVLPAAAR